MCNNLKAKASIFFFLSSSFQLYWSRRFQVVMKGQPNFSLRCKNGTKLIKPSGKCLSKGQHVVCFFPILQILTGAKKLKSKYFDLHWSWFPVGYLSFSLPWYVWNTSPLHPHLFKVLHCWCFIRLNSFLYLLHTLANVLLNFGFSFKLFFIFFFISIQYNTSNIYIDEQNPLTKRIFFFFNFWYIQSIFHS